ncbi:MAG: glycosyltransferase [Pseudomonadota bacterium]
MTDFDISVVIPCHNEAGNPLLQRTLASVIEQAGTFSMELLVVDDGSTDRSADRITAILRRAGTIHPYRLIALPENRGIANALNEGIGQAKGRFICRIDCGDIALPGRFQKQVDALETAPWIDVVGGLTKWIDTGGVIIGEYPFNRRIRRKHFDFERQVLYKNYLVHTTWMVRRDLYDRIGRYDSGYALEDYEFLVRTVARGGRIAIMPDYLTLIYMNPLGLTGGVIHKQFIQDSLWRMKKRYFRHLRGGRNAAGLLKTGIGRLLLNWMFPLYLKLQRRRNARRPVKDRTASGQERPETSDLP